jgi:DUF1365 family protein
MSQTASLWLGQGEVLHTRLRPVHNAFRYPVFFLRVQVDHLGSARLPWPLRYNRRGWLSLYDSDYGNGSGFPLTQQIRYWLAQVNITDVDGDIWLHTFPRVCGFVFNPVSFWFCERANGELRAVLCEVNNTFGERHWYLLANDNGQALHYGQTLQAQKCFYVSPFFPVQGTYRFRFGLHSAATGNEISSVRSVARIEYFDTDGDLLHTSISGTLVPATTANLMRVLWRMPCMTLAVIGRIHWQALRLWMKRIRFYKKPAPPRENLTRSYELD